MRRINAIITALIMILFLVHMIWGGLELIGVVAGGSSLFSVISWTMLGLIVIHIIIAIKLTADTIRACRLSGVSYFKQNKVFWIRRISGVALLLFIAIHVLIFMGDSSDGLFLLAEFTVFRLITQILMVISLIVHLLTNIPPLRIAFGLEDKGNLRTDIILILGLLLLLAAITFVIYFIRWMIV